MENTQEIKREVVYISGRISGLPDQNKPKFEAAENLFLKRGFIVINPHKLPEDHNKSWASYMKECIKALVDCDSVIVLDDWKQSSGAVREVFVALFLQIPVYEIETLHDVKLSFSMKVKLILNLI